jgi:DUF1365 family protein
MTVSALYIGSVRHRRHAAPVRELRHSIALAYLDLDELPALLAGRLVRRRPGVVRVRRRDLLGGADDPRDLRDVVTELIASRSGRPACDGPVRVLTYPRTFGTCFNPVSFYYAFGRDERLDAVVAEVTNTPWGQRHAYVLRRDPGDAGGSVLRGSDRKLLHVSPFQEMERTHRWAATTPGPTLSVHIANQRPDGMVDFDATLKLERRELSAGALRACTLRYPAGTLRVLGLIYGHAIALKLRGARHVRKPATEPAAMREPTR